MTANASDNGWGFGVLVVRTRSIVGVGLALEVGP
jgi:hypothetical protein